MEESKWCSEAAINALDRTAIGETLASKVARKLVADDGVKGIWNSHRDYCGHGLVYDEGMICLTTVRDGDPLYGEMLGQWQIPEEFIKWLARQSDYTLSGADAGEPLLYTKRSFSLNNQRLTRGQLEHYVT